MFLFRIFFFCLLALCHNALFSEIIECQRLKELLPYIEENTLVVFNINNVLTVSLQDAGSTPWAEQHIAKIAAERNISKPAATNAFIPLWHDILIASDVELFDPDAANIVHYLQSNGTKVMALTNRYIEMGYPTHRNLRSVGIDFVKNPPYPEDCFIIHAESPSKYIEGIIFNGLINFKGDTLAAFLQQINYRPKKLIYIEDKPKHLAQVEKAITALGIPFLGIHFGALDLQRQSYREELADLQVRYHQDILDDTSALKLYAGKISPSQNSEETSQFNKIHALHEIKERLSSGTLLITELDQVLWTAKGSIGQRLFLQYTLEKQLSLGKSYDCAYKEAERLVEKIQRRAKVDLIDNRCKQFLDALLPLNCWSVGISYRPVNLFCHTLEQLKSHHLKFNSPFPNELLGSNQIIMGDGYKGQFIRLDNALAALNEKPSKIVAVSTEIEDLNEIKALSEKYSIEFEGYCYRHKDSRVFIANEEFLALELDHLEHLLTNQEAEYLLVN